MAQPSDLPSKDLKAPKQSEADQALEEFSEVDIGQAQAIRDESNGSELISQADQIVGNGSNEGLEPLGASSGNFEDLTEEQLIDSAAQDLIDFESEAQGRNSEFETSKDLVEKEKALESARSSEFFSRVAVAMGEKPEQKKRLLERMLGEKFDVSVRNDQLFFKKKDAKKWFPLDNEGFRGGFSEFLKDTFADNAEVFLEATAAIAAEVGAIKSGASLGGLAGGALGGLPGAALGAAAGGTAGFIGSIPASAAAGEAARTAALIALGEPFEDADQFHRFKQDTAINALALGLGTAVKKAGKAGIDFWKNMKSTSPQEALKEAARVRQSLEEIYTATVGSDAVAPTVKEIESGVRSALSRANDSISGKLSAARDEFMILSGAQRYPTEKYVTKIDEVLEKRFGVSQAELSMISAGGKMGSETRADVIKRLVDNDVLGDGEAGAAFASKLLDEKQLIDQSGGLGAKELFDKLSFWKKPSGISPRTKEPVRIPGEANQIASDIRSSLVEDKLGAYKTAFANDTGKLALITKAERDYADKIGLHRDLKDVFRTKEGTENIVNALIEGKGRVKGEGLVKLQELLGAGSQEFQDVRTAWFNQMYDKAIDPKFGIVKADVIEKELARLSAEASSALMTERQKQSLKFIAKKARAIQLASPATSTRDAQLVKNAAAVMFTNYSNPGIIAKTLWTLTSSNADVAKYLNREGLLEVITENPSIRKKLGSKAWAVMESFGALMDAARPRSVSIPGKGATEILEISEQAARQKAPISGKTIEKTFDRTGQRASREIPIPAKSLAAGEAIQEKLEGLKTETSGADDQFFESTPNAQLETLFEEASGG